MASPAITDLPSRAAPASSMRRDPCSDLLHSLVAVASCTANAQLDAFVLRLADALLAYSEASRDPRAATLSFHAANTLRNNGYAFYYLASARIEATLRDAVQHLETSAPAKDADITDDALTLVPFDEMDRNVALGRLSRPLESLHAVPLEGLGRQIAQLLARDALPLTHNPFRPEAFLRALHDAWCEFDPEAESHALVLQLLRPDVFLDLSAILQELIDALAARGLSPEAHYRLHKSDDAQQQQPKKSISEAVSEQLKHLLNRATPSQSQSQSQSPSPQQFQQQSQPQAAPASASDQPFPSLHAMPGTAGDSGNHGGNAGSSLHGQVLQMAAVNNQLLAHLASMQKTLFDQLAAGALPGDAHGTSILPDIKRQAPQGMLTPIDETKIDLLSRIFDVVFRDQNIPSGIKPLIGLLQVPVLKAALLDEEFFFQDDHPARRLIELLSRTSLAWDQHKGSDDPLYQTMQRNVTRVQQEFNQQVSVFSDVVSDLESFVQQEEAAATEALAPKISNALRQEKIGQAAKAAKHEVALRIGSGEVVAFVEGFLEKKWVPVLTLAYSIKEEKPDAVENAVKTMDDLIWSVKPKITPVERKELVTRLPGMLAALNQWLNLLKWEDAERLQFFAELAECHASIVRAPLDISPQRQLEIAMDVAKQAAERRLQKRAEKTPEPLPDAADQQVRQLERGVWMEFTNNGVTNRVRLAWISPLRTLYIFSTADRKESFSLSAENLALGLRQQQAKVIAIDQLVGRALAEAVGDAGANDAEMHAVAAA
jgi:hypothetical protein